MKLPRVDPLYEALSICFDRLSYESSLASLVCFSACNTRCQGLVRAYVKQLGRELLTPALQHAAATGKGKDISRITWLVKAAGRKAVAAASDALVVVPRVPADLMSVLLKGGLQISSAQLIAAARARIPGIEAWVKTHLSGLSALEEAICTHNTGELQLLLPHMPPSDLPDMLHLAVNAQQPTAAAFLLEYLQQLPQLVQQMQQRQQEEQKAAPAQRRRGVKVLHKGSMRVPPPLKQLREEHHQEQQQLRQRFQQLLQEYLTTPVVEALLVAAAARGHGGVVFSLLALDGARGISSSAAASMMHHAVRRNHTAVLVAVCRTEAAKQLGKPALITLLSAAVQRQSATAVRVLMLLPAAQQLEPSSIVSLLESAVQLKACTVVSALLDMPTAPNIGSCSIAQLLHRAVEMHAFSIVLELCHAPAAQMLSGESAAQLLQTAMQLGSFDVFSEILDLPAVQQQLTQQQLVGLLETAAQLDGPYCQLLTELPAAEQELDAGRLVGLLRVVLPALPALMAAQPGSAEEVEDNVRSLLELPAAFGLDAAQVGELLQLAVRHELSLVGRLCMLPAAEGVSGGILAALLRAALQSHRFTTAAQLCRGLPAARQQLDASAIPDILQAAVKAHFNNGAHMLASTVGTFVSTICSAPAAQQMAPEKLAALLEQAVSISDVAPNVAIEVMSSLCDLDAASRMSTTSIESLLLLAVQRRLPAWMWRRLTCTQPAIELPAASVADLLGRALQQECSSTGQVPGQPAGGQSTCVAAMQLLCGLPSARRIEGPAAAELLRLAMKLPDKVEVVGTSNGMSMQSVHPLPAVNVLAQLDGVKQLHPAMLAELLQTAVTLHKKSMVLHLTVLQPAVQQLDEASTVSLLRSAVRLGRSTCLSLLCKVPAVQQLSEASIAGLIHTGIQVGACGLILERLCGMHTVGCGLAGSKLDGSAIAELLHECLRLGNREESMQILCKLPDAHAIPADDMVSLLTTAVQQGRLGSLGSLCGLRAAKGLDGGRVADLVEMAEQLGGTTGGTVRQHLACLRGCRGTATCQ